MRTFSFLARRARQRMTPSTEREAQRKEKTSCALARSRLCRDRTFRSGAGLKARRAKRDSPEDLQVRGLVYDTRISTSRTPSWFRIRIRVSRLLMSANSIHWPASCDDLEGAEA